MSPKTKLLLVGWDAADWQIINPLLQQGKMPSLARLMNGGAWGNLATLDPPISPMLWTSIATGKRPYKHGIHGFTELAPDGENVRPVRVTSRKCKAVWNILNDNGYKTNVIGWWPSHPAEKLDGVCVSNFFAVIPDEKKEDWPLFEGAVFPENRAEELAELRLHPKELTAEIMHNFFPNAIGLNSDTDPVLRSAMRILAHATSVHAPATHILETTDWDFTAVYFDALDHFSHLGMKYHPPQLKGISDRDFKNYSYLVEAAYRFHDMLLDRLLDLAGENCNVILVSDHGFESNEKRLLKLPEEPGAPALEHRQFGVFVGHGANIKAGQVYGASLLDVAPTILNLFGLPAAEDFDGNTMQSAVKEPVETLVETYESGERLHESTEGNSQIDGEMMVQLEALGYIKAAKSAQEKKVLLSENEYYLARSLADGGKFTEALKKAAFLEKAFPEVGRYANYHASLLLLLGQIEALENWLSVREKTPFTQYLRGLILLQQGKPLLAAEAFQQLNLNANPSILAQIAAAWQQAGNAEMAKEFAQKALLHDAENGTVLRLLGDIFSSESRWEEALSCYFKALNLLYHQPLVHQKIGTCFYWLNMYQEAVNAFEVALRLAPTNPAVIEQLVGLFLEHLNNPKRLAELQKMQSEFAIVVTGFPRSGTSLLMNMLQRGGIEILSDNLREADKNNPEGYFELEAVKSTASDQQFLCSASGKAVKIVMPLLRLVNPILPLKVIWMERDLAGTLQSQQKMKGAKNAANFTLLQNMQKEQELMRAWLNQHPHLSYLTLHFNDVLAEPQKAAEKVQAFLGKELQIEQMIAAVKQELKHF